MTFEVCRELSDRWYYRIRYPGGGGLGGYGYATSAQAWRALGRHLAELGHDAPVCPHCGMRVGAVVR